MKTYTYARSRRALEVVCIVVGTVLLGVNLRSVYRADEASVSGVAFFAFLGVLLADFISGLVHWAADTYGDEKVPWFGAFVRTFREHHTDPTGITRHDWIETNGDVFIFSVPVHILLTLTVERPLPLAFIFGLFLASYANSQIHKWAHEKEPPFVARILQRTGIALSPKHHERHHVGYVSHYCITTGWTNALLDRLAFFRALEAVLGYMGIERHVSREGTELRIATPERSD